MVVLLLSLLLCCCCVVVDGDGGGGGIVYLFATSLEISREQVPAKHQAGGLETPIGGFSCRLSCRS